MLRFIKDKRAQHKAEDARAKAAELPVPKRPTNYLDALKHHEEHLEAPERPFKDNPHYDENGEYATKLMQKLSKAKTPLVKVEYLMILNHRPHIREFLCPMLEDMDARYNDEEQDWIVETISEVLGKPGPATDESVTMTGD